MAAEYIGIHMPHDLILLHICNPFVKRELATEIREARQWVYSLSTAFAAPLRNANDVRVCEYPAKNPIRFR